MREIFEEIDVKPKEAASSYQIKIGSGLLNNLGDLIRENYCGNKILLVADRNVMKLYAQQVEAVLYQAGFTVIKYVIPPGETAKSFHYLQMGYNLLIANKFSRNHLVVALGGGVTGDLAGFLAATFMRGIPYIQVPTTLLAQVDSSVGGKTAINHPSGKNLIGSFYNPRQVIIDINFLKTLPFRELKTGMAEVIKKGLIADADFFNFLLHNKQLVYSLHREVVLQVVGGACQIKVGIVEADQLEKGERTLLNFGHTIGHALETVTAYQKYTHGEAVAIGMNVAALLSHKLGYLKEEELALIKQILKEYELPLTFQYQEDIEQITRAFAYDKKNRNQSLRWVLLRKIGKGMIKENINDKIIKEILEGLQEDA